MTPGRALYNCSFVQAQAKIGTCRFEVLQTSRFAVLRTRDDYRVRPQADLDFPPPEFEGTATADLLEALAFIASWLKASLCMIDQVLLVHV